MMVEREREIAASVNNGVVTSQVMWITDIIHDATVMYMYATVIKR